MKVPKTGFPLRCGIEIHTQLNTKQKLFAFSKNLPLAPANENTAFFDYGLPGTFPHLNPEALLLALKAAAALQSNVSSVSSFDRKHYFYPDQPLGYQITQRYRPLAKGGFLTLSKKYDNLKKDTKIGIEQIQLEQDTGKLNYNEYDQTVAVDLNRANVPLIELVTKPDFTTLDEVKAFVKKYLALMSHLGICTGDLENGAMRCDVNISVCGGNRVEIKNLGSTSEIMAAANSEYLRQVALLESGKGPIKQETRGWNGRETTLSRSKEESTDYRYLPDSELPAVHLSENIVSEIRAQLPPFPEEIMEKLVAKPYGLEVKHARFLVDNPRILDYYYNLHSQLPKEIPLKKINNWLIHELLGTFNKLNVPLDLAIVPPEKLADLIRLVASETTTQTSAKLLLDKLVQSPEERHLSVLELVEKHDLATPSDVSSEDVAEAVEEICIEIINSHQDAVERIRNGKRNSINFLIGQAMKETQGKVKSDDFRDAFKRLLGI